MKIDSDGLTKEVWVALNGALVVVQWRDELLLQREHAAEVKKAMQACGAEFLGYL